MDRHYRKTELAKLLNSLCLANRISKKQCKRAQGELRFMATAVPGAQGLFGALHVALSRSEGNRIHMSKSGTQRPPLRFCLTSRQPKQAPHALGQGRASRIQTTQTPVMQQKQACVARLVCCH